MMWKILGIEPTKDEDAIKTAYRNKLHYVNPEDDEEGFKELRRAYEEALEYASQEADDLYNSEGKEETGYTGKKDEVDLWIDRIDMLYRDVVTRRDERKWDALLHDPVCDDLDTELEAAEKLLVYFMSHTFMPQAIWKMVDKRFHYIDNYDQLKERFPENYLDYVKWQTESPNFIDFELFDGKTDDRVDEFISKLFEVKGASEEQDLKKIRQLLNELECFELTHPYVQVEEARYLLMKDEKEEALSIMEELDFEYSENSYIERIYAETLLANQEIDKARAIYDEILEKSPDNYTAMLGQANCIFLAGDPENAKEQIEDILEERVQDAECLALLDEINEKLVKDYEKRLETEWNRDICFKLGWCYYQQKKFEKGIALLERLESEEDYDDINLRCRLYLASENYEQAYPLSKKWLVLIENSEDDGSREMTKRKNRLSLAYFSVGVCIWETVYKKSTGNQKRTYFSEATFYIKKAVAEEHNTLVKLSYMEQLARFYLEAEEYKECIEICNDIIEQDRGFFPAYVHRQKANYELKNAKEVIDDYFACQEIYPAYAQPYVLAAEVFFAFDQYDDVENIIAAAKEAELESDSLELYRIKCIHYKDFSKENVESALEAVEVLRNKINNLPEDEGTDLEDLAELEREYAALYWDMDDAERALDIIDCFLKKHSNNSIMLHLKADILNRENNLDEALKVCKYLVKMEPDNLYTRLKLGNCYERLAEFERAIDSYDQILKKNPKFVPALRRMMYLYSYMSSRENDLTKCKLGIRYATRYIEMTGTAEGYVERGNLYIDVYELEKAVSDCKKAIELDSEAYYAYNNLGCALLKLRRVDEAIIPLEHVIEMEPDKDHLRYLNLAECYMLKKEYDKAIHAYEEALRIHPEHLRWKEDIADIYVEKKEYDKAIRIYQTLIDKLKRKIKEMGLWDKIKYYTQVRLTPENERIYELYGEIADVYRRMGDLKKADQYYKKTFGLQTNPIKSYSLSASAKAAEFYRDIGNLRLAEWILDHALKYHDLVEENRKPRREVYFVFATVSFEQGNQKQAERYANLYLKNLFEMNGEETELLSDLRYRPMNLFNLALMNICAGNLEKGKEYLGQIPDCKLCVTCETCDCFEYYLGSGLIAELEGCKDEAKRLYEKAIEIKGDYPYAKRHLDNL